MTQSELIQMDSGDYEKDLSVSYTNGSNFGGQSVQSFSVFESDFTTPHQFITSSTILR